MHPSVACVPESASLGMASALGTSWAGRAREKRAVFQRWCSGGATVPARGVAGVGTTVDGPISDAGGELGAVGPSSRSPGMWSGWRLQPRVPVPGGGYARAGCWAWHRQRPRARPCEQRRLTVLTGLRC